MRSPMLFIGLFGVVASLRITSMSVPRYGDPRQPVTLSCHYSLEKGNPPLYCVNWYIGKENVLGYQPKRKVPIMMFNTTAVKIITGDCNKNSCSIKVQLPLSYNKKINFTCEVSEDGPMFTFVNWTRELTIAVALKENPEISVQPKYVYFGDYIMINCSTAPAMPPAKIRWFVNRVPILDACQNGTHVSSPVDGAHISWNAVRTRASTKREVMELLCEASQPLDPPHKRSGYYLILLEEPPQLDTTEKSSSIYKQQQKLLIVISLLIITLRNMQFQ